MTTKTSTTRAAEISLFAKIVSGVNLHVTAAILLGGQSMSASQIVAIFQAAIQASSELEAAKTAYQQKLAAQQAAFTAAHTTEASLKSYVYGAYGKTNPLVTDFGFDVAKAGVKTVKAKAAAALKSAATRVARGTKGPKQKALIHGVVAPVESSAPAPVVTPPVTTQK